MLRISLSLLALLALSFPGSYCLAQDLERLGGDLSTDIPGHNGIQVAAPNVVDEERRLKQLTGFITFHRKNIKSTGLGPNFINSSCGGCHVENGKGAVKMQPNPRRENQMLVKVALKGLEENGAPRNIPGVGEQLLDRSIQGRRRSLYNIRLRWRKVKGRYPDGSRYVLRKPLLRFRVKGVKKREIASSLRMTPALIGMGLLEAIPEESILAMSDPGDANGDGISGIPNYVPDRKNGGFSLGRFGFRASHPSVEQQTAAAAFHDMGITNSLFEEDGLAPELPDDELERLVLYQMLASVPMARDQADPEVIRGKALFQEVACDSCHRFQIETRSSSDPELDGQIIHPFTDLLLHDMGPALADERDEFSAKGSEWRTTPLWGLGFLATVSKVSPRYLHDGRARTIEEAILWHGGEAEASKQSFMNLPKSDREALMVFLRSL